MGGIKVTFEELMGAFHDNADVYNALKSQLESNSIIPIIGAGLSCWAGYPLWGSLLKKVAEKSNNDKLKQDVNKLIEDYEYEKAADTLEKFFKENRFMRKVNEVISSVNPDESKRPPFHQQLKKLFKAPFVTTNYDKLLETLLGASFVVNPQDPFNEAAINSHLQNKKHFIIKLHGTVDDPTHMILTKKSYNKVYGDNPEEPDKTLSLPRTLEAIFKSSFPLFLGCSLDKDRTCAVFKNCVGTTGFALVEKPDNQADFDKKDAQLDDMNLQVIWYPHGQHEAVEVLINQLAKDMGIGDPSDPDESTAVKPDKQEIRYSGSEYFIGRDDIVNRIAEKIDDPDTKVLLVHGVAGIGKTEICKAVYRQLKAENPDFSMPFIDVAETKSVAEFWERLAKGLDIKVDGIASSEQIFELICNHVYKKNLIVYLDNFEDVLSVGDEKEKGDFINILHELSYRYGLRMLISSQERINFGDEEEVKALDSGIKNIDSLSWEQFRELNQVKLFINAFGREPKSDERESFRTLISELSGHPLSIIITALYDRKNISIKKLLNIWQEIVLENPIPGDKKDDHRSLVLATELPWRKVKDNKAAVFRWALHAHCIMPLDSETLSELNEAQKVLKIEPFEIMEWTDGGKLLRDHGLTYETEDRKEHMLLALKKLFPKLGTEAEEALAKAFVMWIIVCGNILERGDNRTREDYQACHYRALDFLPQCFNLAESCLEKEEEEKNVLLKILLRSAVNFYQFDVINSIPLLNKLIEKTDEDFSLRSRFYYCLGDLLSRTGELEKALEAYDEAEKLYKSEQNNLGLANVLSSRGDLLNQTGELEKALEAYDEAEKLYKSEQYNLGLANVLLLRGNLLSRTGELEKALEAYDKAEELYKSEQDNLGLANVIKSRGDLLSRTGELEKALEAYNEAEKLYKSEQNNLGLANVLRGSGDLMSIQEDWKGAEEEYEKALPLYIQVQYTRGASYTLADLQLCKKILGDDEGRKKCLEELEKLLPKQPESVQMYVKRIIEIADSL